MTRDQAVRNITDAIKAYRNGRSDRSPDTITVDLIQLETLGLIAFDPAPQPPLLRPPTPAEVITDGLRKAKLGTLTSAGVAAHLLSYLHDNGYDIIKHAKPGVTP